MDGNRGLHAWHLDMRDARRRGLRRGILLTVPVSLIMWWGIYEGVKWLWH